MPSGDTLSQAELSSECNLWAVFSTQYLQQATVHWQKPFTKSTKSFITFRNVGKKGFYFHIISEEFLGCLFGIHLFVLLNHKCLLFVLFSFLAEIFHTLSKCLLLSADFTKPSLCFHKSLVTSSLQRMNHSWINLIPYLSELPVPIFNKFWAQYKAVMRMAFENICIFKP